MDTIDVSNLNRQFLFRSRDVGKPKAEVAAARVMERVAGVAVTPHFARIEDKPNEWYQRFHIIVLGLDSLEARSYMNAVACSFLEYDEVGGCAFRSSRSILIETVKRARGSVRPFRARVRLCLSLTVNTLETCMSPSTPCAVQTFFLFFLPPLFSPCPP